jgi:hypothetical protein
MYLPKGSAAFVLGTCAVPKPRRQRQKPLDSFNRSRWPFRSAQPFRFAERISDLMQAMKMDTKTDTILDTK